MGDAPTPSGEGGRVVRWRDWRTRSTRMVWARRGRQGLSHPQIERIRPGGIDHIDVVDSHVNALKCAALRHLPASGDLVLSQCPSKGTGVSLLQPCSLAAQSMRQTVKTPWILPTELMAVLAVLIMNNAVSDVAAVLYRVVSGDTAQKYVSPAVTGPRRGRAVVMRRRRDLERFGVTTISAGSQGAN